MKMNAEDLKPGDVIVHTSDDDNYRLAADTRVEVVERAVH